MPERLYVLIRLGADRYAIEAAQVVEVTPLVRLKVLPGAPVGTAGVMNFRDEAVPVVDLNLTALGVATAARLSTRIVIVRTDDGTLGLLVPEVTETRRLDPGAFVHAGVATGAAPYLGPVLTTPTGVIQRVAVADLLTPELRDALQRSSRAA